jgi:hypothetical protein
MHNSQQEQRQNQPETRSHKWNSRVIILGNYEIQVLNSYSNRTYRNRQAGAVYMQYAPLVNPNRKEGEWQSDYIQEYLD